MLSGGSRIGSYEIKSQLGEGGMGVVFRALDTKLQREVALKLLPAHVAADPDRLARFQREAQVLASLNHPNIAQIHGLEDSTEQMCIVMELVDGQTLQERIKRGPIPWTEALPIAKQICEALEAAHERGIIHRDLKPANIKLTPVGTVKVLDFGLAKAIESTSASASVSNSPTLSMAATNAGVILGTAAYMSPEQAKGRAVDRRSDIFAFGCVLFEMLTAQMAFEGEDVTEIIGRVVTAEPDWSKLPADAPPVIHRLIRRVMRKDPRQRLSDIHDVRLEIDEAASEPGPVAAMQPTRGTNSRAVAMIAAVAVTAAVLLAIPATRHFLEKPLTPAPEMRLEISTPSTPAPLEFELSPDGRYLVFVAAGNGAQRLWLRSLDKTDAQPLPGTDGAGYPFWSPDSRAIGFYVSGKLKRIEISGGTPQVLANASASFGGTWNANGTIIFSSISGPLSGVSAAGGDASPVTKLGPQQAQHRFPKFLPDGRHFVFFVSGSPDVMGIYLGSLDSVESKRLIDADSTGIFLAPDLLVFGRGTTLMARHLDLQRGELTGDPIRLGDFIAPPIQGLIGLSISPDGRIAYRFGGDIMRQLKWYERSGKVLGAAGEPDPSAPLYPELSSDGRRVALMRTLQGNTDVWLLDLVRGGMTRFTFDVAVDLAPVWSPDGTKIAFGSNRKGPYDIYVKQASGAVTEEPLVENKNNKYPQDWSSDGTYFLYGESDPKNSRELFALPLTGSDRKPITIANTRFDEQNGEFSPDGRFVAYQTNDSGVFQIVVQPFPQPTGKWQVSAGGGIQPRWKADGKELYFVAPDGKIMAATTSFQGATFNAGTPIPLFTASLAPGLGANRPQYAVSHDGRLLLNQAADGAVSTPITLILNWKP